VEAFGDDVKAAIDAGNVGDDVVVAGDTVPLLEYGAPGEDEGPDVAGAADPYGDPGEDEGLEVAD